MTTEKDTAQIPDEDRMTAEAVDAATVGFKGRERWHEAARVAEGRGYNLGWVARGAMGFAHFDGTDEADGLVGEWMNCAEHCWCAYEPDDYPAWATIIQAMKGTEHEHGGQEACTGCMLGDGRITVDLTERMVKCPGCNGTGKMHGWGDQCKRCYGATVVKASSVEG